VSFIVIDLTQREIAQEGMEKLIYLKPTTGP